MKKTSFNVIIVTILLFISCKNETQNKKDDNIVSYREIFISPPSCTDSFTSGIDEIVNTEALRVANMLKSEFDTYLRVNPSIFPHRKIYSAAFEDIHCLPTVSSTYPCEDTGKLMKYYYEVDMIPHESNVFDKIHSILEKDSHIIEYSITWSFINHDYQTGCKISHKGMEHTNWIGNSQVLNLLGKKSELTIQPVQLGVPHRKELINCYGYNFTKIYPNIGYVQGLIFYSCENTRNDFEKLSGNNTQ